MSTHLLKSVANLIVIAGLAGCASSEPDAGEDGSRVDIGDGKVLGVDVGGELLDFTTADLDAALASAEAHQDVIAAQCYRGILAKLPELKGQDSGDVKGALSAFQKARNIRRARQGGMSDEIKLACGPLLIDAQGNIMKLLARFGAGPLGGLVP